VSWLQRFKPAHPNFELIFVSEDHDRNSMFNYMKEMNMPWPAVRFGALSHDGKRTSEARHRALRRRRHPRFLVLLDAGGTVLADSYENGKYVGPEATINEINRWSGAFPA